MFSRLKRTHVLTAAIATLLGAGSLQADTFYWDKNGIDLGAGATPTGNWNLLDSSWNITPTGDTTLPGVWANTGSDIAVFSAGSDATGASIVTLNAGQSIKLAGITVEEGAITLNSADSLLDRLSFDLNVATLNVASGATLAINSGLSGTAGLAKSGLGTASVSVATTQLTGPLVVNGGVLELTGAGTISATTVTLGGLADSPSTLTLGASTVLELGGTLTFANAGNPPPGLIQGGTINLSGNRSFAVMNSSHVSAAEDLVITSVIADGSIAGSSLTKANNGGVLVLTGANTYTGETSTGGANSGTLIVRGNEGSIAGSTALNIAGGSTVTIGSNADNVAVNRLGDTAAVNLNGTANGGAQFNYLGSTLAAPGTHEETFGTLAFNGPHRSVVTVTPASGHEVTLNIGTLERSNGAVGLIRGNGLGATVGTASSTHIFLTNAPVLVGGDLGTTAAGIFPHLLGDASSTGNGTGFLTYDPVLGLRVLNSTTEQTSSYIAGQNVRQTAATTVSTSVRINSLQIASGNTSLSSGAVLGVESGGVIFTGNATLGTAANPGTLDLASVNQGIIHLISPGSITATINAVITGSQGLILSASGTGTRVVNIGGNNTFTGGLSIYNGTYNLTNAGGLNASGENNVIVQSGTLRLSGQSVTIAGLDGNGTVHNNHASNASTLTVNGGGTYTGGLENGNAATFSLIKTGATTLSLQGTNTFTGLTRIEQGILQIGGGGNGGTLSGTSGITILAGATLRVSNTNGNNNLSNRLNASAPITFSGGTLDFDSNASAGASYLLTTGAVTLQRGANQITADQATTGQTSTLNIASIASRGSGATLNVTGNSSTFGTVRNRVDIGSLSEGFVGGWATAGNEFIKYIADIDPATDGLQGGLATFVAADYVTTAENDAATPWAAGVHAKPAADQTLTASHTIRSLNLVAGIDVALDNYSLNLESGGLIKQGGSADGTGTSIAVISGAGTLTAGGTASQAELFVRVTGANLRINSGIVDNPGDGVTAGSVSLVKSGAGTLELGASNLYTGATYFNEGTIQAGALENFGTGAGRQLIFNGGKLKFSAAFDVSALPTVFNAATTFDTQTYQVILANAIGGNGAGGFTKSGTGSLTLQAANTYTGPTTVSAGTLVINGSISGAANVLSGATIGGAGTVGAVTLYPGGSLAPGDGVGTLQASSVNLATGSILSLELNTTTADLLQVSGKVTMWGDTELALTLAAPVTENTVFSILTAGQGISGYAEGVRFSYGAWGPLDDGAIFNYDNGVFNQYFQIDYDLDATGTQTITLLAVPEPSTALLLGLGLPLLGLRRFRRRS